MIGKPVCLSLSLNASPIEDDESKAFTMDTPEEKRQFSAQYNSPWKQLFG